MCFKEKEPDEEITLTDSPLPRSEISADTPPPGEGPDIHISPVTTKDSNSALHTPDSNIRDATAVLTTPSRASTPPPGEETSSSPLKRRRPEGTAKDADEDIYGGLEGVDALVPTLAAPNPKKPRLESTEENNVQSKHKPHIQAEAQVTKPLPTPPEQAVLAKLTVKVLKAILTENELSTSGLKNDLVTRVFEFYNDNRDKIRPDLITVPETTPDVTVSSPSIASKSSDVTDELENFDSSTTNSAVLFSGNSEAQTAALAANLKAPASVPIVETGSKIPTIDSTLKKPEPTAPAATRPSQPDDDIVVGRDLADDSEFSTKFTGWLAKQPRLPTVPVKSEYACRLDNKKVGVYIFTRANISVNQNPGFFHGFGFSYLKTVPGVQEGRKR